MAKLFFTAEYNKTRKDYRLDLAGKENIWPVFSSEIRELWPGIKLPFPGSLSFSRCKEGVNLHCKKPLTINGVSVTDRTLKQGDRIIIGPLRIFYNSTETETEAPVAAASPSVLPDFGIRRVKLLPAAIITGAIVAAVIAGCVTIPRGKTAVESPDRGLRETAAAVSAEQIPAPAEVPERGSKKIIVIPPGGTVPDFDLDILFIHAHPDDESLDFGCLMALADTKGMKTGLVTFTDGESGLDLYPLRPITNNYPDHYMEGAELASVRSVELEKAAGMLGVDVLIRLGLKNHPYNSIADELTTEDIIDIWGGEIRLSEKLRMIMNKTSPETVVAPEGPGKAREHFEHEAVGYIVSMVMSGFRQEDYQAPKRFITSIDPRQHELYPEASKLDAGIITETTAKSGSVSLRQIQLSALIQHKTQNDAVNVGAGFLPEFDYEYYQIHYWRTNNTWNEWIAELDKTDNRLAQTTR